MLSIRVPRRELAPCVESLWYYESDHAHAREIVLPSTRVQLLLYLGSSPLAGCARVVGPTTRPALIETKHMRRMVGVTFKAGGAHPFLEVPCDELCDQETDLAALSASQARELIRVDDSASPGPMLEILENLLLARAKAPPADHAMVAAAVHWLDAGTSVADVVDRLGVSRSRFVRTFAARVGTKPKTHASLSRFRRALSQLATGAGDLAGIAADCGYSDQPHFCHEFRRLAGRSPTEYRPRSPAEPSHLIA